MCGIAGLWPRDRFAAGTLERMTDALRHRGPDAGGFFQDTAVGLGHRRLAIVDLSANGAQPMCSADGRVVIAFNGEIYNHAELRGLIPGHPWRSTSDTETILELYCKLGIQFIGKLVGMFSICLYDVALNKILIWRDRLGEKPLYYHHGGGRFAFASELKSLLVIADLDRTINREALQQYLLFNYLPDEASMVGSVKKLLPGHRLELDLQTGAVITERYWALDPAAPMIDGPNHQARFEELFLASTRGQMMSDVPLGCFLSGGIDSSAVALALQKNSSRPIKTFTIGFAEAAFDEAPFARAVSKAIGTEHTEAFLTEADVLAGVEGLAELVDEPFADASILPTALLCKLARQHVTVALSGDAGDELFLGYDRYRWARAVARRTGWMPGALRRAIVGGLQNVPHYKLRTMARGLTFRDPAALYGSVFAGWNAPFVRELLRLPNDAAHGFDCDPIVDLARAVPRDVMNRGSWCDLHHYLPGDILTKVDRASMAHSLETRVPLLDHRLVEFAWSLPTAARATATESKIPLRRFLQANLPFAELFDRPKAGFAVPLRHWFRGALRPLLHDLLSTESLRAQDLFDAGVVQTLLMQHDSGRWNHERQLFALLVFQLWYRRWHR